MSFVITAVAAAFVEGATAAVILTAVAEVGVALTVVGTVTKSPELTKLGGAMSLVGGVGGIINGVATGAIGAAATGVGEGVAADAAATSAEAGWAGMANDAVAGVNAGAAPAIDFAGNAASAAGSAATAPGLSAGNSIGSFLGAPAASSASGVPGIVPDASGTVATATNTASPFDNEYGVLKGGDIDKSLGVNGPLGIQSLSTPADSDWAGQLKNKLGSAWDKLSPLSQAEMVKSVLAMPGGIQNQKNVEAGLAIQQQKANQSSYGSQVPTFGIINKAKG